MAALVAFSATGTLTIQEGTDLLVVVVTRNDAVGAGQTATWDPVVGDTLNLSVAHNTNDWTQVYYLVDPPAGDGQAFATGSHVEHIYVGQYSGDLSFDSAQAGDDNESFQFSPSGAAVMVYGMIAFSTSHTPVAGCTERADEDGSYYCDRIESSGGTYTVGITSGDEPAGVGALFVEASAGVDASGTPSAPAPTASGAATIVVSGSGAASAPAPTASGTASPVVASSGAVSAPAPTASGTASPEVAASGSVSAPAPTASGSAVLAGVSVSGTPSAPAPAVSGSATVEVAASGAVDAPAPTASGAASPEVVASGAVSAPAPTASGAADLTLGEVDVSGAVSAILPSATGTAVRLGGIRCDHPRPKLELPGYTPPRLAWQPPAYLPPSLEGLARAVREGFQGVFNELARLGARRNVVPLIEDIRARDGQIITGVGQGQVIELPAPVLGQPGLVTVILTEVEDPVTVVRPDGSTVELDQPGVYDLAPADDSWQAPPGVSSAGSAAGVGYLVDATHASVPNARVATDSTEIDVELTTPNVATWALRTASVVFGKLQNLTGLSVLGRASSTAGVMAAITASAANQVLKASADGTVLEFARLAVGALADITGPTLLGRVSGSGAVQELTGTQATTLLDAFTDALKGLAPASGGGTTNFLRADGAWEEPPHEPTDGDKGDITVSSSGATWTIDNGVVTNAKAATVPSPSLKGRTSSGTGTQQDLVPSNSTSCSWNTSTGGLISVERAALTGDVTASANSNSTTIANDSVTNAKLANMASPRLKGRTTSSTGDPEDLTLTNSTSATWNTSTGGTISVERAALTGDVTASANSNATTIANNVVSNAKLRDSGACSVIGRSVNSSGDPADISAGTNNHYLRRVSNVVGFGDPASTSIINNGGSLERAALTGEVTASQNGNALTINRSTNFASSPWTGDHIHAGDVSVAGALNSTSEFTLSGVQTVSTTGSIDDLSVTGNVVRFTGNSQKDLRGMLPVTASVFTLLVNVGSGDLVIHIDSASASTTSHRFAGNNAEVLTVVVPTGFFAVAWRDAASSRNRVMFVRDGG